MELNLALVAMGGLVLFIALLSSRIDQAPFVSPPIFALLLGIALGPAGLDLLDPVRWGDAGRILDEAAHLTLGIGLMGVALRLPKRFVFEQWRSLAAVLGLVMPAMAIAGGLVVWWAFGLPFWVAMLTGAVVSPTDPIVATSIVHSRFAQEHLPEDLRNVISAESGANDGLAHPLVLLPILLLARPAGAALLHWSTHVLLYEVGLALAIGAAGGYLAGRLLGWSERTRSVERTAFLAYSLALTLFVLGAARLAGTDGILAVFVAGLAFDNAIGEREQHEEENVQEAVNQFFTLPIFALFGLMLPWDGWFALGWSGAAAVAGVLLLRRLPAVLAVSGVVPLLRGRREAAFAGWFGPIGVAAMLYAQTAVRETGRQEVWVVASLAICASVLVHGMTSTPFTRWYSGDRARD